MLEKFFIVKSPQCRNQGYTLAEVIVALSIMVMTLTLALSAFSFTIKLRDTLDQRLFSNQEQRNMMLFFEKQILYSEKIFVKGDIVYLHDVENKAYYNQYLITENIYKTEKRVSRRKVIITKQGDHYFYQQMVNSAQFTTGVECLTFQVLDVGTKHQRVCVDAKLENQKTLHLVCLFSGEVISL